MIKAFKDSYKINLFLTGLFFLGVLVSAYVLYRLPNNLMVPYGYESAFSKVYIFVGLTFLIGAVTVLQAMRYRKELIVYRDKEQDTATADRSANENKSTISEESIKAALRTAKNEKEILQNGLQSICNQLEAGQGAGYTVLQENDTRLAELTCGYAFTVNETSATRYNFGEGLIGQAASNGQLLYLDEVPEGYIKIISGLGSASPRYLLIAPVKTKEAVLGVLEIASFSPFTEDQRKFVEQGAQLIADTLSNKK